MKSLLKRFWHSFRSKSRRVLVLGDGLMDFFDVRKLSTNFAKDAEGLRHRDEAVAFLPILMIAAVVVGICGVYHYRRWKHDKRQLSHLTTFYDIVEANAACSHGKHTMLKSGVISYQGCEQVSRALQIPPADSTPFFQPTIRTKGLRIDTQPILVDPNDIIYHFSHLGQPFDSPERIVHIV